MENVQQCGLLKAWLMAARIKMLPFAIIPITLGTILAYESGAVINFEIFFLTLLTALCVQVGMHLINDGLDYQKGTDTHERLGFPKVTVLGLLSAQQVLIGGYICLAIAALAGVPLVIKGGIPLLLLLVTSLLCAYLYTGGPYPLSYIGVSDFFAFVFFGLLSTAAAFYLQTETVNIETVLAGFQLSFLVTIPTALNNLRDVVGDAKANKRTLAVRFGKEFARYEIAFLALFPYFLGLFWLQMGDVFDALLPLLSLPIAIKLINQIFTHEPSVVYNQFFSNCALLHRLFSLLLIIGIVI